MERYKCNWKDPPEFWVANFERLFPTKNRSFQLKTPQLKTLKLNDFPTTRKPYKRYESCVFIFKQIVVFVFVFLQSFFDSDELLRENYGE